MNQQAANQYLRSKVFTATPEQLQLMLYDGAIRFAEQGRAAVMANNFDQSHNALTKAQKILTELNCGLKHDNSPELCGKLAALYNYCYRQLVEANVSRTAAPIDEALKILRYQRETWTLLMHELGKTKAGMAAQRIDAPAPDQRMEASLSVRG